MRAAGSDLSLVEEVGYLVHLREGYNENALWVDADVVTSKMSNKAYLKVMRQRLVHRPWVVKTRNAHFGGEFDPENIPPWLTAVSWSDGAVCELQGVLHPDEEAKDDKVGIRRMKCNKSRT